MSQRAVVREFASEAEAALAAATLRSHGIHAGTERGPTLAFLASMAGPTVVTVPVGEVDRARVLLNQLDK